MDFNIRLSNGQLLKGIIYSPGEDTRGVVVMVHGLGEHMQRYTGWAERFINKKIAFTGVDLPGHGRSDGNRGNVRSFKQLEEMISILLDSCKKTFPGIPVYLYGQSLGGGIVLDYLLRVNPKIKAAIVTSPWLTLSFEPPRVKVIIAALMNRVLPGLIQPSGLEVKYLSSNPLVAEQYVNDPLVHDKISVGLFYEAVNAGRHSLANASDLKIPTLILHAGDDKITSPAGSLEFASRTSMVELKIWPDGYHELHNSFPDEIFDFIMDWLDKKSV